MLNLLKARSEIAMLVREWRGWSEAIERAAIKVLGPCEVYVFGSVVKGHETGGSDVDMLIIADHLPRNFKARGNLKARIEEEANLPLYHPFEIHIVTREEAEANHIYREAIKKGVALTTRKAEK